MRIVLLGPYYPFRGGISDTNQELFKGGTIIRLDNKVYLVMVPYGADRIYIYNISEQSFTFIKDPLFKTNKFASLGSSVLS